MTEPTPNELFEIRQRDAASGDTEILQKAMASDVARPVISLMLDRRALLEAIEYVREDLRSWGEYHYIDPIGHVGDLLEYLAGSPT